MRSGVLRAAVAVGLCGSLAAAPEPSIAQSATAPAEAQPAPAQPASDAAISARVRSALQAEQGLGGLHIEVATSNGVVRLTGYTESSAQMSHATELARRVSGVRAVSNELRLNTGLR